MVRVNFDSLRERDLAIDLENGFNGVTDKERSIDGDSKILLNAGWNGLSTSNRSNKNEEDVSLGTNYSNSVDGSIENGKVISDKRVGEGGEEVSPLSKNVGGEKPKKKSCKKPPKPPRPPRAPSMDAADQKIVQEMSELAMLKRARIERMKALKRMKNAKSSSSSSNLFSLFITVIFCFVLIWQGLFSRGGSSASFQGSPESLGEARSGFISVQFYKDASTNHDSSSVSPKMARR